MKSPENDFFGLFCCCDHVLKRKLIFVCVKISRTAEILPIRFLPLLGLALEPLATALYGVILLMRDVPFGVNYTTPSLTWLERGVRISFYLRREQTI